MSKRLHTATLIIFSAMVLEVLKVVLVYVWVKYLPEPRSELASAVYAIALFVFVLPETLVSYENGPHGVAARIVMFVAGVLVNTVLITLGVFVWRHVRGSKRPVAANL